MYCGSQTRSTNFFYCLMHKIGKSHDKAYEGYITEHMFRDRTYHCSFYFYYGAGFR